MLVSWFRDGVSVDTSETVRIDEVTSLLAITNLTANHAGNYSCVAKNEVAVVSVTASLVVKGNYAHRALLSLHATLFLHNHKHLFDSVLVYLQHFCKCFLNH